MVLSEPSSVSELLLDCKEKIKQHEYLEINAKVVGQTKTYEPHHGKTKTQLSFVVTTKLINAFVSAT